MLSKRRLAIFINAGSNGGARRQTARIVVRSVRATLASVWIGAVIGSSLPPLSAEPVEAKHGSLQPRLLQRALLVLLTPTASSLPSKAAVRRLVTVTLAGLRPPH